MKMLGILCALALLWFAAPTGYAQDRDSNNPKAQPEVRPQDTRQQDTQQQRDRDNNKQQEQARPGDQGRQEDRNARPDETKPQDERNAGRREQTEPNRPETQQREQHPANGMRRGPGQQGRHIPDDQFRAHFGRQHTFHVQRNQIVNVSQPVIVYGGYSFEFEDAWPADWSYDDDCYIDYIDGEYFLFDVLHPGMRMAVFVIG